MLERLSRILIESGVATPGHVRAAQEYAAVHACPLDAALIALGAVEEEAVFRAIARASGVPFVSLSESPGDADTGKRVIAEFARTNFVLPLRAANGVATVAMANPADLDVIGALEWTLGMRVEAVVATRTEILFALDAVFGSEDAVDTLVGQSDGGVTVTAETDDEPAGDLTARRLAVERSPVIKLVNKILVDAVRAGASDVHVEPQEASVQVRYRVDGLLKTVLKLPKSQQDALISRMKIVANMDIADRRRAQDGRARLVKAGASTDLRVSTLPTLYGEKVVVRILEGTSAGVTLAKLGLAPAHETQLKRFLALRQGILLVTGPTGSGKTTTLYACLNHLRSETSNIVTIEDPIEYRISDINQVQVNEKAGLTFASSLKSILRQDPNIIMVGEIRDQETAALAFAAAQTGHLILSTLHTNDAAGAVTRLTDLGIEPFLVSSSLIGVVAQRLVRRLCPRCAGQAAATDPWRAAARAVGAPCPELVPTTRGCETCHYSGYAGRAAVVEILEVTEEVRAAITRGASDRDIAAAGRRAGLTPLAEAAVTKAIEGLTTLDEATRVTGVPVATGETPVAAAGESGAEIEVAPSPGLVYAGGTPPGRRDPSAIETILVVDDSAVVRRVLRESLENEGWEVREAEDGVDAWQQIVSTRPALVVTDLGMPRLDGYGLIRRMKDHRATADIPVLMLTSQGETEDEVRSLECGADDYVSKAADNQRVLARIRRLLRQRQARTRVA